MEENYPEIICVSFITSIAANKIEQHIASIRSEGFPQYTLTPKGEREQYTAIKFIEPFSEGNLSVFGFDMYTEKAAQLAMDDAKRSNALTLAGKASQISESVPDPLSGVRLFLTLYRGGVNQANGITDNFLGWIEASLSFSALIENILLNESQINVAIYDDTIANGESLLYSSKGTSQQTIELPFLRTKQLVIAQRSWTFVFSADNRFAQTYDNIEPSIVMFVGGLFTVLLTFLIWTLSSSKRRAETKAAAMTRELSETEFRLNVALSGAAHGVWDWNNLTNEVTYDSKWKSMLGYADDEIKNEFSEWQRLLHPQDRERAEAVIDEFISGKTEFYSLEHRLKARDGRWLWIVARGDIVSWTENGDVARTIGTHTDITSQKSLELALRESEQRFRGVFETSAIGIALVGLNGEWIKVNQSLLDMLQYEEAELLNLTFQDITHPDDISSDLAQLKALTAKEIQTYQMEKRYFRKDSSIIWIYLSVSMVTDIYGAPIHYVSQIVNITDRKELQNKILHQSTHDELTGLPNRRLLYDRLSSTFALSRRYNRPIAVMYIDIDHFKQVNDEYGHDVGDKLLKWLANKISFCIRTSDTLARHGGDEFVLMLTEISKPDDTVVIAEKIFHTISEVFSVDNIQMQVTLSVGIAIFDPQSSDSIDDLLKKADLALYRMKRNGRNGFRLYEDGDECSTS
ncbi:MULTISPECIES: sensor domain-containing diguanylate cyclase [Aliiglaciecola]|uniref:sensor domain-containing diguanylate cyclase n=1 Tax=Aliiglaciecola TaxID=1406885 RepID=UPI00209135B0|nr:MULTISPECIES: diguanylate cyclase [Aliiglaciecola]MDO6711367.1 diguanylate cyclase [Aliiglaciecola sp. 2_MG-2023]MDO6752184.1 diguanylate cyclase [Aliiglaciecola sp. 1_MG-2023]